ncbi:MAG TPA: thymidine kinase [Candidatus Atribacteria bacterium]|nr:thymidine kinase [Candidatus Atribacteria bacterium]
MAKLYFRYGAMGASKSANALMVKHNYMERGQEALLVKPAVDARDGEKIIRSRIGVQCECELVENLDKMDLKRYSCIIVDEAQFLTKEQVMKLVYIVDELNIPVICYGLRTDFKGELFEGSKALMEVADTIEEIKTICFCGRKATMNARFDENGNVIKTGEQIVLGANDKYIALCRKHWMEGNLGNKKDK